MTKKVKWGVSAAIVLMIVGMIMYPKVKSWLLVSDDTPVNVPDPGTTVRRQILTVNAEILNYQELTDKVVTSGSIIPDEEVDLSFESSGKLVTIYFKEGTQVKEGDLLAKLMINLYKPNLKSWRRRFLWLKTVCIGKEHFWRKMQ